MTDIVVVAHRGIGEAMCSVAEAILSRAPEVTVFPIAEGDDPDRGLAELTEAFGRRGKAPPPLVMTDLPGATPHNIAVAAVRQTLPGAPVVTGLNLPMLLRAINHRQHPAGELAELAARGAHAATYVGERVEDED